uniref:Uncharacterized protein n=1 Tax=Lepeophtheirus salmonis TaxID=72036 RepID=A0A0K2TSB0_LEPSM
MIHVGTLSSSKQLFLSVVLIIIKATSPYCSPTCIIIILKKTCLFSWVSNNGGTDVWNYDLENKSIFYLFYQFLLPMSFFMASYPPLQKPPITSTT